MNGVEGYVNRDCHSWGKKRSFACAAKLLGDDLQEISENRGLSRRFFHARFSQNTIVAPTE